MNERLKELAEQVGATIHKAMHGEAISFLENDLERFVELVRQDERGACARVCAEIHAEYKNDKSKDGYDWPDGDDCAEAIRARGNRTKTSRDICGND